MWWVLHGSARTTEAVRRATQLGQESVRALARRYGVSPTPPEVQKWRKRETTTTDAPMGPKEPRSTVLTPKEGDDHRRCPARHTAAARRLPLRPAAEHPGISRDAIGYFHIDIAEVERRKAGSASIGLLLIGGQVAGLQPMRLPITRGPIEDQVQRRPHAYWTNGYG